jgi:nucleotide-binding universal stress UspA family protein
MAINGHTLEAKPTKGSVAMNDFTLIVAYDGTAHADDAVVLANLLARDCQLPLVLAHVYRQSPGAGPGGENSARERERFLSRRGEQLLAHGARLVEPGVASALRVVGSTTTATGIRSLAERGDAGLVIFGSAAGTLPGRVHPGSASRRLLQVLSKPLALAPAGYRSSHPDELRLLAVASDDRLGSAGRSAVALAAACGARSAEGTGEDADLVLIGSGEDAAHGRLRLTSRGDRQIQAAAAPVLVVPWDAPLEPSGTRRAVAVA